MIGTRTMRQGTTTSTACLFQNESIQRCTLSRLGWKNSESRVSFSPSISVTAAVPSESEAEESVWLVCAFTRFLARLENAGHGPGPGPGHGSWAEAIVVRDPEMEPEMEPEVEPEVEREMGGRTVGDECRIIRVLRGDEVSVFTSHVIHIHIH